MVRFGNPLEAYRPPVSNVSKVMTHSLSELIYVQALSLRLTVCGLGSGDIDVAARAPSLARGSTLRRDARHNMTWGKRGRWCSPFSSRRTLRRAVPSQARWMCRWACAWKVQSFPGSYIMLERAVGVVAGHWLDGHSLEFCAPLGLARACANGRETTVSLPRRDEPP